jgi:hypothetical protein
VKEIPDGGYVSLSSQNHSRLTHAGS